MAYDGLDIPGYGGLVGQSESRLTSKMLLRPIIPIHEVGKPTIPAIRAVPSETSRRYPFPAVE